MRGEAFDKTVQDTSNHQIVCVKTNDLQDFLLGKSVNLRCACSSEKGHLISGGVRFGQQEEQECISFDGVY